MDINKMNVGNGNYYNNNCYSWSPSLEDIFEDFTKDWSTIVIVMIRVVNLNKILISSDLKSKDTWEVVIVMTRVVNLDKILISYDLKSIDRWEVQTENHVDKLDFKWAFNL